MELRINESAPDFALPDQDGKESDLKSLKGKWVVLYFYPKDDTPGCTIEAVDFTKYLNDFEKLGAKVIGISADSAKSHCSFIGKHDLKLKLLSDTEKKVIKDYGVWQKKKFMGREYMGIVRSTFIIDTKGKIVYAEYGASAKGHAEKILNRLRSLIKR